MTTPEPDNHTPNDLVPHLVPDLVPGADGAPVETTSSPVPSSSIGDEVSEPPPPRPTTSSPTPDEHPHEHPHEHPERRLCDPMDDSPGVVTSWTLADEVALSNEECQALAAGWPDFWKLHAAVTQIVNLRVVQEVAHLKEQIAGLAVKRVSAVTHGVTVGEAWEKALDRAGLAEARVSAALGVLADAFCLGCFEPGHPCGSPVCELRDRVADALALSKVSAAGEFQDQPHEQHEGSEAAETDRQDDEQLSALGVADQGGHGGSVGAPPAEGLAIEEIRVRHRMLPARGGSADIEALLVALDEARAEAAEMRERGDRWQHSWLDQTANLDAVTAAAQHPHKGPDDTDASMLLAAAKRLDGDFEPGGSHTKQTIARVLRAVAALVSTTTDMTEES